MRQHSLFIALVFLSACGEQSAAFDDTAPGATSDGALDGSLVAITTSTLATLPGGTVTLSAAWAKAKSPAFQWQESGGSFADASAASTSWRAPNSEGDVVLTAQVTDGASGASGTAALHIKVSASAVAAAISADMPTQVAGELVNLSFVGGPEGTTGSTGATGTTGTNGTSGASGATGTSGVPGATGAVSSVGGVTFTWTQASPNSASFGAASGNGVAWRAPAVAADGTFVIAASANLGQVTVVVQTTLTVEAAQYARDVQPIWQQSCLGCHAAGGSAGLDLTSAQGLFSAVSLNDCGSGPRVVAGDAEASPLFNRLRGSCAGGGKRMPPKDKTYFDRNPNLLMKIQSWILAGAKVN